MMKSIPVSDPTCRERWPWEGQWSVRTERTGWGSDKREHSLPSGINTITQKMYLSVRGRMETTTASLD